MPKHSSKGSSKNSTKSESMWMDLHVGVSPWKEHWVTRRNKRVRGVWDASLQRETLVLHDGRKLTYFLDGPLLHRTDRLHIFCFHAMFLSGNCFLMTETPKDCVLVCVNRPGYYGSDPVPSQEYAYHAFAHDMEQLADHLGVDTFAVAGHSSGGPCALACAVCLPHRVKAVGILSGDPEYAHDGVPEKRRVNAICLGKVLPFMLKYVLCCLPLARGGREGLINDYRLETSKYSFRTEHAYQPTIVFVGEDDKVMPFEVSRHVHERLENAKLRVIPNIGHLGLLRDEVLSEFFETLCSMADGPAPVLKSLPDDDDTAASSSSFAPVS
jgi:pimeloyl-ACP methyl ester carboxylesterase